MHRLRMIGILAALAIFLAACGTTPPPSGGDTFALEVTTDGTGTGTVTATVDGEPVADMNAIEADAEVILTAVAGADSEFTGWAGACAGTDATCVVTMDADKAVTATFDEVTEPLPTEVALTVEFAADSLDGTVSQAELGILCSVDGTNSDCSAPAVSTTEATTFTATPGGPDIGIEWVGLSCANGETECAVTPNSDPYVLTVRFYDTTGPEEHTGSVAITAGGDDGFEWITDADNVGGSPENATGYSHSTLTYAGMGYLKRYEAEIMNAFVFRDLGIPAGATITGAYIQFTSIARTGTPAEDYVAGVGNPTLRIRAEASAEPASIPADNASNPPSMPISSRTFVAPTATWSPAEWTAKGVANEEMRSADLTALLQALVDLGSWDESGDAAFVVDNQSADPANNFRQISTYEQAPGMAPVLHFTYTIP